MNFNKERFTNFAKYDLTINRTFYRNMALATAIGTIGIATLGFTLRHSIWLHEGGMAAPESFESYNYVVITAGYVLGFLTLMMIIFSGCTLHNLRNKQGRITELTLPATNLEKFLWHMGLMHVGGFILCIVSLLLSDAINALLTLIVYGAENGVASLTAAIGDFLRLAFITDNISFDFHSSEEVERTIWMFRSLGWFTVCYYILNIFVYLFGNAIKYKYNIILTYISLQVIGFVFIVASFICEGLISGFFEGFKDLDSEKALTYATTGFFTASGIVLLLAAFLGWLSYQRYTKAQITSPLNR